MIVEQLASAVMATLEGLQGLSKPFDVQRVYAPAKKLWESPSGVHLLVIASGQQTDFGSGSRDSEEDTKSIRIVVHNRVSMNDDGTDADPVEASEMISFCEELTDYFKSNRRNDTFPEAAIVKIENDPLYSASHLSEKQWFVSTIQLDYRIYT